VKKCRPTLTKIIAVLFETLTRVLVTLRYAVTGVGRDWLRETPMLASREAGVKEVEGRKNVFFLGVL